MATRLFFPDGVAAPVTPVAPDGADWEHINGTGNIDQKLLRTADSSALSTVSYAPDGADHLVNGDANHRQYVSDALAAQTVTGNIKAQFQCLEAHAGNNLFITLKVYVISNDGTTAKETLLAITRDTTLELATSLTNRTFSDIAMTSATLEDGDRLCVEVGLGGTPTGAGGVQGHNGSIRWGCSASSGDLPEDDTQTGTTYRPWIEFANTLTFQATQSSVSDTVTFTDTLSKMAGLLRGDTVSFTEGFSAALLKMSSVADTLGLSETFTAIKNANAAVGDTVALAEGFVKSVSKATSDTLGLTEGFSAVRTFLSNLGDTLGITEAFTKSVQKQQAETVTLTENLDAQIGGGGPPAYIFKVNVVPVYVAPDPAVPGVVPVYHTSAAPGVTRVHTIDAAYRVHGCVPVRLAGSLGIGIVPVIEEV